MVGGRGIGVTIKGQQEENHWGDRIILYPDCDGGYRNLHVIELYTLYINVNFLDLIV